MHRLESAILVTALVASAAVDAFLVASRCAASATMSRPLVAVGLALQLGALLVPWLVTWKRAQIAGRHRLRWASLSLLLVVFSLPLLEYAVRYADAIGREKSFVSEGLRCRAPLP